MKTFTIGVLAAVLAVSANAYPGMYRFSGGYSGIQVSDTHFNGDNVATNSDNAVNGTGVSVQPAAATKIVVRGIASRESVGASATAGLTNTLHGSVDAVHVAESAGASTGLGDISESAHGSIDFIDVADSTRGSLNDADSTRDSVNNVVDSTPGSDNIVPDSTRDSVNNIADSTRGSIGFVPDSTRGSINNIADSTRGSVDVVKSTPGAVIDVADSTRGSVDSVPASTGGSVNFVPDSTRGAIDFVVDSTRGSVDDVNSTPGFVTKVADSTRGSIGVVYLTPGSVIEVADSTCGVVDAVKPPRVPAFTVGPDSKLRPYSTEVNTISLRPVIPTPPIALPGVFPRGIYGVYGSSGRGYMSSTATSDTVAASTPGFLQTSRPFTKGLSSGIKAVSDPVLPGSESTEVVIETAALDSSTQGTLTTQTTTLTTDTIVRSLTSTVTQLVELNPSYKPSISQPCTAVATVTVTVIATDVVASYSPTMVKYSNVTMSTSVSDGSSSAFSSKTSLSYTIDPCMTASLPGFVGLQLPSGSGASCTVSSVTSSTTVTGGGSVASTPTPSLATGAVGTTNVNIAFLAGFAALILFV